MFRLFKPSCPRRNAGAPRQVRLGLEVLEERDCPAATSIGSFSYTSLGGNQVQLSGYLAGTDLEGSPVTFGGVATGQTAADASGYFSLQTSASGVGTVSANAYTPSWQFVDSEEVTITTQAPTITLSVTYGSQRQITLSGQVTDEDPGGLLVSIDGAALGSVYTNSDGTFSVTLEASYLGTVEATVVDAFGVLSNTATVTLTSAAPQISDFSASKGINNVWTFRGRVTDESAAGLIVSFGGLASVQGQQVTVESDGSFCLIVTLQPGEEGTVTAATTDWWGLTSNTAARIVRQS